MLLAAACGGCQPKDSGAAPTSAPSTFGDRGAAESREPLRRVEVVSHQSARVAETLLGRRCRVQLRRDALGVAGATPVPLAGRWANESSVEGSVVDLSDQWLVVRGAERRIVIPHASILLIELQD